MNTLTIIEGPDLAGKSTYAREVEDQTNDMFRVVHMHAGPPKKGSTFKSEYFDPLVPYMLPERDEEPVHIICDRWHIGELVYPKTFNRPPLATPYDILQYNSVLSQLFDFRLVVMMSEYDVLEERWRERGDKLLSWPDISLSRHRFAMRLPDIIDSLPSGKAQVIR